MARKTSLDFSPSALAVLAQSAKGGASILATWAWEPSQVYAVRADWAESSSQIDAWSDDEGWFPTAFQVADFRHSAHEALRHILVAAAEMGTSAKKEAAPIARAMRRSRMSD